jgi:hypothetical protein
MTAYSWTGPGNFTSSLQNPTRDNATLAMAGNYTLTVTDANGCTGNASTNVVVNANPVATASSNSPVCEGTTISLTGGPDGMTSYSWTGPNGFSSALQSPTITNATLAMAGAYTLTVIDANGCTDNANTNLVVNAKPVATASSNSPICEGDTISLTGGPDGMTGYSWIGPGNFTSSLQDPTIGNATLAMANTYTLTVTDANGCTDSANTNVMVFTCYQLRLSGWGLCTSYGSVINVTLDGCAWVARRSHAPSGSSIHLVGNLTLGLKDGSNETIDIDLHGSRVRSLFYLSQEVTGKSVTLVGVWEDAPDNQYYIMTQGWIALPSLPGSTMKTARLCYVVLRTPDVEVPTREPGSFVDDVEYMLMRMVKFLDMLLNSLIGTGFGNTLGAIWAKILVLLRALRELGVPYVT